MFADLIRTEKKNISGAEWQFGTAGLASNRTSGEHFFNRAVAPFVVLLGQRMVDREPLSTGSRYDP